MIDDTSTTNEQKTPPRANQRHSSSYDSSTSDEGYCTDDKSPRQDDMHSTTTEIPIIKTTQIIRISYTPITYTLAASIIILSIHTILSQPFPWIHTFPPIFILFHLFFHLTHMTAHLLQCRSMEQNCIVYGTWFYCTGWLLSRFLFSEKLSVQPAYSTTLLFWLLMLERRNAWGIIVWEFTSKLVTTDPSARPSRSIRGLRSLIFHIWCLLGTGSLWGLIYMALAKYDGYHFHYLLQLHHLMKLLLVSTVGGLLMFTYWSFWTFQIKGVLWTEEFRKGIVVWYSEGVGYAAELL
ncbi:hypothetical protein BDB01DRAFT_783464 [Pilobolus umbonatus]|nr:hypothetical protein BDB01DRAFT_783464 [Pilobolus umbonatus]